LPEYLTGKVRSKKGGKKVDYEALETISRQRQDAKNSLADYLQSFKWDSFFTATFKYPAKHPRLAIDRCAAVLSENHCTRAFVAAEPFYLGNYHAHGLALFAEERDFQANSWGDSMLDARYDFKRAGYSKLSLVKNARASAIYCAKYLTKELSDYDFIGDWH